MGGRGASGGAALLPHRLLPLPTIPPSRPPTAPWPHYSTMFLTSTLQPLAAPISAGARPQTAPSKPEQLFRRRGKSGPVHTPGGKEAQTEQTKGGRKPGVRFSWPLQRPQLAQHCRAWTRWHARRPLTRLPELACGTHCQKHGPGRLRILRQLYNKTPRTHATRAHVHAPACSEHGG